MDFSTVMDFIHASRFELVEMLAAHREQVLKMLDYLVTSSPSTFLQDVQDVSLIIEDYFQLKDNVSSMLLEMDALEQELVSQSYM